MWQHFEAIHLQNNTHTWQGMAVHQKERYRCKPSDILKKNLRGYERVRISKMREVIMGSGD